MEHLGFTTEQAAVDAERKIGENLGIYPDGLVSTDFRGRPRPELPMTTAYAEVKKREKESEWFFPKPTEEFAMTDVKGSKEVTPDATWYPVEAKELGR